jgi:hypothetical protein
MVPLQATTLCLSPAAALVTATRRVSLGAIVTGGRTSSLCLKQKVYIIQPATY